MNWSIRTKFYTRTNLGNGKFEHQPLFNAEIFGENIWISESDSLPGTNEKIVNFQYLFNPTYSRVSNGLVNTHFRYFISPDKKSSKIFAKLNWWQRFKLKVIMNETGYQRNPIEFLLLTVTFLGVVSTIFITLITSYNQQQDQQKLLQEIQNMSKEVQQTIQHKQMEIHNQIDFPDTLLTKEIK